MSRTAGQTLGEDANATLKITDRLSPGIEPGTSHWETTFKIHNYINSDNCVHVYCIVRRIPGPFGTV